MMPLRPIIPRKLLADPARLARAIENALDGAAKAAKVDFGVTTQTWTRKPVFTIEASTLARVIATDNEIYGFVNDGTKPHIIKPKNGKVLVFGVPSSAKTAPRVIGSGSGGRGNTVVKVKSVHHPGTEAREFAEEIAKKWREQLPVVLQRAIDSEV